MFCFVFLVLFFDFGSFVTFILFFLDIHHTTLSDLVINGLQDRVKSVQNACTDMLLDTWLPSCQNNVEVLLTHLEVDAANDAVVMVYFYSYFLSHFSPPPPSSPHSYIHLQQEGSPPRGRLAGELVIKSLLERWYGEGKGASWNFFPVTEETRMSCERALIWRVHCEFLKEKVIISPPLPLVYL